jgi:hypothetical protein
MVITRTTRMGRIRITGNRKVVWEIWREWSGGFEVRLRWRFEDFGGPQKLAPTVYSIFF